ncbi:glycoside hydrolase family 2 protein [Paenibacillus nasutitermitis]|uniref:Hydrolase n=1 Tax=Paenibacillus nasutitermitis TaxID=1652958 RepID=A0A916YYE7_9BACL|nr:sugar-binding domain-containing protein [Paenibacillus nasutitermitis]GGD65730.1 hydrolase [Paenibacillus nasutitermitis]
MSQFVTTQTELLLPRPEFPRPDWERSDWNNLNGEWSFQFDSQDQGRSEQWFSADARAFDSIITVPFSWASPLSGIGSSEKGIAWYRRQISWQPAVAAANVFLRFGAVDYACEVWVNGIAVGSHTGGYGNFEFDVTSVWNYEGDNLIAVRTEDFEHDYQARGKQGYGEIRGIWQPVWLESRPGSFIRSTRFNTAIDGTVSTRSLISAAQAGQATLEFSFGDGAVSHKETLTLAEGDNTVEITFKVGDPQLWSPESPYLYEGHISLDSGSGEDRVSSYFGIREISTALAEDRSYRWITLNGKPVYLNGTLDQSFHPTGYFTYPTDQEMHDEIYLMKKLGLNFVRIHIKPEEPRKLYWADMLGILVMEDMPCFWGEPGEQARASYESEAREIMERDYNHPSIFSWVMYNETWGLKTNSSESSLTSQEGAANNYLPDTQEWVRRMYHWAKDQDPTRIIEDNSPCNYDHVESDINTWHFYINGYEQLQEHVNHVVENTYAGSSFNYIGGNTQSDAPLMNSECGNVWGIEGGAGDSDLSWHYRYMMNEFRRHDKMCGFVFTEFRDVINEFNGYYRLDGSDKQFGYEWYVPGMSLADLHSPDFIVIDAPPCETVKSGQQLSVKLSGSSFSDRYHGQSLTLQWELWHDNLGIRMTSDSGSASIEWNGYGVKPLLPLAVTMPAFDALAVLAIRLLAPDGTIITRNFITFDVRSGAAQGRYNTDGQWTSLPVGSFTEQQWDYSWSALEDHKINGTGSGSFTYEIALPDTATLQQVSHVELVFEASAKRLLAYNKEKLGYKKHDISYMHGAKADPEYNLNSYPMTGTNRQESRLRIAIDGVEIESVLLTNDPADSRGALSWHYQTEPNKLHEAGSYGYLVKAVIPSTLAANINRNRSFKLELRAEDGGLALYGRNAGRYPIDLLVCYL